MTKTAIAGLVALFMSASPLVHAQQLALAGSGRDLPSTAELKAFTDARIDVVKTALQLTPDQTKLWPAVEEAIRSRADVRQQRLAKLASKLNEQQDSSPIDVLRERADALSQRSAALKKLVDAWQPLYETLEPRQKLRLRFLAAYALREMRDEISSRRDKDDDDAEY